MTATGKETSAVSGFIHRHLLKLVVASYALAAVFPGPGEWLKDVDLAAAVGASGTIALTAPKLLLWVLLFNAGIRARPERVVRIVRRPGMLAAGIAANVAAPLAFLAVASPALRAWPDPEEGAVVLVGLALVSAMPIAGSSTGWAQAADGDMGLSLGLVLGSTFLSPLTTPACLRILGWLAPDGRGDQLRILADRGMGGFLLAWVLVPSLSGVLVRAAMGEGRVAGVERWLRVVAPASLLLLGYVNASSCLPRVLADPDWDFLGVVLVFVLGLCALTFSAGGLVARASGADRGQKAALMFGLGMNNNGTGMVLASTAMAASPMVLLPIIVYTLAQHLAAGCVDRMLRRPSDAA